LVATQELNVNRLGSRKRHLEIAALVLASACFAACAVGQVSNHIPDRVVSASTTCTGIAIGCAKGQAAAFHTSGRYYK
jgi:hypothetical protein